MFQGLQLELAPLTGAVLTNPEIDATLTNSEMCFESIAILASLAIYAQS